MEHDELSFFIVTIDCSPQLQRFHGTECDNERQIASAGKLKTSICTHNPLYYTAEK